MSEQPKYIKEVEQPESSSTFFFNKSIILSDYIASEELQFQDEERTKLIIKAFEGITHQINPKYRNCIDSMITDAYMTNTPVSYNEESGYKIMFSTKNSCIIFGNGKLIEVEKSVLDVECNYLGKEVIPFIYTKIYKSINKNLFDTIKFFILFADVFNIDYKELYDNIPYVYRSKIESILKKKYSYLFEDTDTAMW